MPAISRAKKNRADSSGIARAEDIDNGISSAQLATLIAGRICALALSPVLGHSLATVGTQPAAWASAWAAKVTAIVP